MPAAPTFTRESDQVRRFVELDRSVRGHSLATLFLVAICGALFRSYGSLLVAATWLPLGSQLLRPFCQSPIAIYRFGKFYMVLSGICVAMGSLATGGVQSPVLMFSLIVGLSATMAFPDEVLWRGLPLAVIAAVVAVDGLDGGWGAGLLMPVASFIMAAVVPQIVSESVHLELTFRRKAVLDPLTGCLNRSSMATRIGELEAQAQRSCENVGVVAIDIDHFKKINDELGHSVGDDALQEVAYVIRKELRRFEIMYRTGGEEFVLILPGADHHETVALAERVRVAVAEARVVDRPITISLGVAVENAPDDIEALLDTADAYLLAAKRAGRNRVFHAKLAPPQPSVQNRTLGSNAAHDEETNDAA